MKKILLTGGNGFIGKNIQESYLAQKYEIVAPRSFELNLLDTDSVDVYFEDKQFDVVIHSAVKPGHRNAKDPTNLFYSNCRMFENLERHKDKFKKFINIGSGAIYDVSKDISNAKETQVFENMPKDEHGFCKYVQHKQIENVENFVDLNIFGIFGKYEDYSIRFISNAICKVLFDLPITITQNRRFSYLFVDDLMPILGFFIENETQHKSYNVVPDEKVELFEIAKIIKEISKKNVEINIAQDGMGFDYTGENSRLKKENVNIDFMSIERSVTLLYDYYESNKTTINKKHLMGDK